MPRIPRSTQQSTANATPLPHSTGDGYAAVGRATQGLGQSIASAGKSIAGAFEGMQNEQEQHEMFKAKLDLTKFQGEQSVYQNDYDTNIQGDGAGHVEQRRRQVRLCLVVPVPVTVPIPIPCHRRGVVGLGARDRASEGQQGEGDGGEGIAHPASVTDATPKNNGPTEESESKVRPERSAA